ncbi:enoyl-CoA hydratase/isomerase family protein [Azospirillum brasilense]|uniref:enoyl-CoA hydratase/isomerase family protein n=1 Tax=Azospirillum argentinense TaxID=2970906 RepID=UPI00190DD5AB|nr:enoyl-CoA hydratase/isomerase family protein [Azospirillum argentinense]MBK3798484.1 enoyl-CoA hydratase/isomerase family protein [Azospirillum argentinense]
MPEITAQTEGAIRILTISNEPKRNAFEGTMAADFLGHLNDADGDAAVRVVVVTGAGDIAFSSGHDLNEIASGAHAATNLGEAPFLRPRNMTKPVIAAVNGHCYAAALILALSCDLRVASVNATFGSPGARLGMLPEGGQIGRLPRLMSSARALELMLTANPLPADEAYRTGFVNRLAGQGEALQEALVLARAIAKNAPSVVAAIKAGVILGEREGIDAAGAYEATVARRLEKAADAREGVSAFLEKRAPVFRGGA